MRILQVSAHYPPDFVSGGTLVPRRFATAAQERGHESAVFAGRLEGLEPLATMDTVEEGIPVRWIGNSIFLAWDDEKNYRNPEAAEAFREFVEEWKPDIVHFHSIQTLGAGMLPIAKAAGAAVVLTMHDFWWSCARQFLVNRELEPCEPVVACGECACAKSHGWLAERNAWLRGQLANVDLILAPSASAARLLAANGIPEGKLAVHENSVDPVAASPERAERDPGTPVRFLYAGGDARLKGYTVLRKACSMARVPKGTALDVYGADAKGFPAWARGREAYGRDELAEVFASHDVLILPSIMRESHSILTREALSAGLAVICTDTFGPEEAVIDGHNGYVVPASDPRALARALEKASNPETCAALAGQGPASPLVTGSEHLDALFGFYDQAMTRPAKDTPMNPISNVLIVIGIKGASGRYRGWLPVEAMRMRGIDASVHHYLESCLPEAAKAADIVVFCRVPATIQILELIDSIKAEGKPVVGDVDDLVFDLDLVDKMDNLGGLADDERNLWIRGVARYRTTFEHCDFFIGSTPTVASEAKRLLGIPARPYPNAVGAKLAQASARALAEPREDGPLRIGYFSGTDTHDADWATVEPAVIRLFEAYPGLELHLGGKLVPTERLAPYADRIVRLPFVAWHELPRLLRQVDVCLAPLTGNTIFNEAKSNIKWLEAALVQTPTVAYPTGPFREGIRNGETGFLASTEDEWYEAISRLLDDADLRDSIGRRAKRKVLLDLSPARQGERYLAILEEARAWVSEHGHHEPGEWEDVVNDEPFSPADMMDPYELLAPGQRPPSQLRQNLGQIAHIVRGEGWRTAVEIVGRKAVIEPARGVVRSLRDDGLSATVARAGRKAGKIAGALRRG